MTDTVSTQQKTRTYNKWAKNDTLEDYSLRYAPRSFRKWSMYSVATAALGGIAYLADFAIGGSVAIAYGFSNAVAAIIVAAVIIFATSVPIAYYSSKYKIDMDLLTRGAGFGYLGSTLTSVIYASFTFIFFSLEGSIMAQAITALIHTPLRVSYLIASLIIIPFVIFGMTLLAKLQVWTMPVWLILLFGPFIAVAITHPGSIPAFSHFGGNSVSGSAFTLVGAGAGAGVILSLIALVIAMILSPLIAWATGGKTYIARVDELPPPPVTDEGLMSDVTMDCVVCGDTFERPDMAACPFHSGTICSLCCSLDSKCHDSCKKTSSGPVDLGIPTVA